MDLPYSPAEQKIETVLSRILFKKFRFLRGNLLGFVLCGSYSVGEADFSISNTEKSDIDIIGIVRILDPFAMKLLRNVRIKFDNIDIDLSFTSTNLIKLYRPLEVQKGILANKILLRSRSYQPKVYPIPRWETLRLVLNSVPSLVKAFNQVVEGTTDSLFQIRNLSKVLLNSIEAYLLLKGKHSIYSNKNLTHFRLNYCSMNPNFLEIVDEIINYRIYKQHPSDSILSRYTFQLIHEFHHSILFRILGMSQDLNSTLFSFLESGLLELKSYFQLSNFIYGIKVRKKVLDYSSWPPFFTSSFRHLAHMYAVKAISKVISADLDKKTNFSVCRELIRSLYLIYPFFKPSKTITLTHALSLYLDAIKTLPCLSVVKNPSWLPNTYHKIGILK